MATVMHFSRMRKGRFLDWLAWCPSVTLTDDPLTPPSPQQGLALVDRLDPLKAPLFHQKLGISPKCNVCFILASRDSEFVFSSDEESSKVAKLMESYDESKNK